MANVTNTGRRFISKATGYVVMKQLPETSSVSSGTGYVVMKELTTKHISLVAELDKITVMRQLPETSSVSSETG